MLDENYWESDYVENTDDLYILGMTDFSLKENTS